MEKIKFMHEALKEAKKAYKKNEIPVGAIVVGPDDKTILGRGHNLVEAKKSQFAHAEVLAINKACASLGDWRLKDCTLYVSLEPCAMCMNLILLSRLKRVVFALRSKKFGYSLDKYNTFEIYKSSVVINEGVCEKESLELLQSFFNKKRK
jgi:tRNA(adenine34) deaminase